MNPTDIVDQTSLRDDVPAFGSGDTLKVHVRVVEGNKERVQIFQGAVIRRQGSGIRETFTVRKVSYGVGVERTFPVHSPVIAKIEVVTRGDVRRAKLYYLRDRVVVSKLAYRLHSPRRGDIVVFPAPDEPKPKDDDVLPVRVVKDLLQGIGIAQPDETELIKRVIALPGETVEGHDGHVFINGQQLVEPYLAANIAMGDGFAPVKILPNHVWVMGDNRSGSADSRRFGQVDEGTIVGRAILKAWPPWDASFL